jgi:hypothetical protein
MRLRYLVPLEILAAVTLAVSVAVQPVAAQTRASASVRGTAGISTPLRTPWGDPDLQGVWTNTTITPLERPESVAGKDVLTDEERTELDAQAAHTLERLGGTGAYNDFWLERGKHSRRTSLIIDPPDGSLPPVTPGAKQQADALTAARQRRPASWEDVSMYDRCITRGMPGSMMPGFYNHNYLILQAPGYVVILLEMIHDARIIPLDGRPHLAPTVRQWLGDSRGRWEGNTLVVETTNLDGRVHERLPWNTAFGTSENLRLIERFTRIDADTIDYQFTVTDPTIFTKPWTAATPMTRMQVPIYEYACHEGNYSIVNILKGAREQDRIDGENAKR